MSATMSIMSKQKQKMLACSCVSVGLLLAVEIGFFQSFEQRPSSYEEMANLLPALIGINM